MAAFSEADASGRFHYTSALKWVENAEHGLYRAAGVPITVLPRRAVSATFERPFVDGDEYVVELAVERLGNSSISYIWRLLDGEVVAVTGVHTVVHLDRSGAPRRCRRRCGMCSRSWWRRGRSIPWSEAQGV